MLRATIEAALFFGLAAMVNQGALAAVQAVEMEWDAVPDVRVDHYELHYGTASGHYDTQIATSLTQASVELPADGTRRYFAVRACDATAANCSVFSNEVSVTPASGDSGGVGTTLDVDFSANLVSGTAPLTVVFSDLSANASGGSLGSGLDAPMVLDGEGVVTRRTWNFGDSGSSNASTAVHTYTEPGRYTVSLTVDGPDGSVTETKTGYIDVASSEPDIGSSSDGTVSAGDAGVDEDVLQVLPIEIGEVLIDHVWQRVTFEHPFDDPVVVSKALDATGADPAVIRIRDIDSTGFSIRAQEWDYEDGLHDKAKAGYMVMERGQHMLPGGILVEAGSLWTSGTHGFQFHALQSGFLETPVVFASVNSVNEEDAVTSRLHQVTPEGFFVGLWEEELSLQSHVAERVDYIAWEPSAGEMDGLRYEVGLVPVEVDHGGTTFSFGTRFDGAPVMVADMESSNGGDVCELRWEHLSPTGARLWVEEERSSDTEIAHKGESVGYFVADFVN